MIYQTFVARIENSKSDLPRVTVPSRVVTSVGAQEQPVPVCGEADGLAYRSVLWQNKKGERWYVELSPELAASGRFEDGKKVKLTMAFDAEPREATIPYELTETLGVAALAERAWEKLTEFERAPYSEWVNAAVKPKKRWKRAERAAVMVRRGEKMELTSEAG